MIRAGLIGFGLGGRVFHAPFLQAVEGFELAAILQRHGEEAAAAYPQATVVRDVESLLAQPQLDLISISTPPATHYELARRCLEAGKHVVLDKPFVATSAQAAELIRLARERKLILSPFQNRRVEGDFFTLRELIGSGKLGRLVSMESRFERYRPALRTGLWQEEDKPGNGLLHDIGSHLCDQALVLFGVPESVTADVRFDRDGTTVNDGFTVHMHYPRSRVSLYGTRLACEPGPRYMLHGTLGSYVKFGLDPQEDALKGGAIPGRNFDGRPWGVEPESAWGTLTTPGSNGMERHPVPTLPGSYELYYENVRDTILGRASLAVTPEQGWQTTRLLELVLESSAQQRAISCASVLEIP